MIPIWVDQESTSHGRTRVHSDEAERLTVELDGWLCLTVAGGVRETSPDFEIQADEYDDTKSEAGERTVALDEATISVLLDWRTRQERERSVAGPEVWVDSGRVFTREDGTRLRPQWISTRFEDLIRKYGLVQHRHSEERWSIDRISRHHRISVAPSRWRSEVSLCRRSASTVYGTGRRHSPCWATSI